MKKRLLLTGFCAMMICGLCFVLSACGGEKAPFQGLNLDDYLTVPEYKGLEIEKYKIEVTKDDIQQKIQLALDGAAKEETLSKDAELKEGDTAKIDYTGKIDGKEFEGGTGKDFDLKLGSGSFIEGFEEGLIGKKTGDKVSLDLKFPEDYGNEKVAGKDVVFDVTVKSAMRTKTPEYNEDFVKNNTDYKTKKEYEKALKKQIAEEKEESAKNEQRTALWSGLLDKTEVKKYPETELNAYKEVVNSQLDSMAEQYQMDRKELLKQYYGTDDEKEINTIIEDSAKSQVKQEMLVEYIAGKEKLSYTDKEKEDLIGGIEAQGYNDEQVKEYTGRDMDQYADISLKYVKVVDFLMENAVEK